MALNVNNSLHGFDILRKRELPDTSSLLYEMKHKKSGASLAYIDRPDKNKTFAIAFTTPPEDDTGVFHILEHSVLCGSDKYPVKEPFVDLLKGSLNTFLNAMTYNDKTVYPVSSKNDKDFLNLVSVYMDAVLHPLAIKDERVFRQEGWHFEPSADGSVIYNGVVYNEMKGAYSQVDNLSYELIMKMLYEGSPYSRDSGGNPDFIPTLTYEGFVSAHKRHYHPENSRIILDGEMDIDAVLSLLDSYLCEFDKCGRAFEIEMPKKPQAPSFMNAEYELSESEDEKGKARLTIGWRTNRFDEEKENVAITLIRDCLMLSNEAPLKKALLDSGLCKDASAYEISGIADCSFVIEVRDINEDDSEKIIEIINSVIKREIEAGFDKAMLSASLELYEFKLREADSGSYPRGLVYALGTLDTWLYGGDPAAALSFTGVISSLRELINTNYYEELARKLLIDNGARATLLLRPSKTLADKKSRALADELKKERERLSDAEYEELKKTCAEFKAWQAREDSPEDLAKLPALALSDISDKPEEVPEEHIPLDGAQLLYHDIDTGGIIYSGLTFDCSDLTEDELCRLSLLASLLTDLRTESYDVLSLKKKLRTSFGLFAAACTPIAKLDGGMFVSFGIKAHTLARSKGEIAPMLREVLYTSDLGDKRAIKNTVAQLKLMFDDYFVAAGHLAALGRAGARCNLALSASEYTEGYNYYLFIKDLYNNFDERADELCTSLAELSKRIFVRERAILNISCERDEALFSEIICALKHGNGTGKCKISLMKHENEAIVIPSPVSYAAQSSYLYSVTDNCSGSMHVARMILNYEHLWNSVRVLGGAYGAGFMTRQTGRAAFYSYRDPSPEKSILAFSDSAEFLREYVKSKPDLTKLIIGAVGALSPLTTPRSVTEASFIEFISGVNYASKCKIMHEVIATTHDDILAAADIIEALDKKKTICVVGGKDAIQRCSQFIDKQLEL